MTRGPNIFSLATRELSQDAFIAWLATWSNPEYENVDSSMHAAGTRFVNRLLACHDMEPVEITKVRTVLQWKSIDVLIEVNDRYLVLIEDKTATGEHHDQLTRYLRTVSKTKAYDGWEVLPIYLKTHDQGSFFALDNPPEEFPRWYKRFLRHDLLAVLADAAAEGADHPIFNDFRTYLEGIEAKVSRWRETPHSDWTYHQWIGFYQELKQHIPERKGHGEWHYVPNPSGGFLLFALSQPHWKGADFRLGLRISSVGSKQKTPKTRTPSISTVDFMVRQGDASLMAATRKHCYRVLRDVAAREGIAVERPDRFGKGKWMRFGVGRYLEGDQPDIKQVLCKLKEYEMLMEKVYQALIAEVAPAESAETA